MLRNYTSHPITIIDQHGDDAVLPSDGTARMVVRTEPMVVDGDNILATTVHPRQNTVPASSPYPA